MRGSYIVIVAVCLLLAVGITRLPAQNAPEAEAPARAWEYRALLVTDLVSADQKPAEQTAALEAKFNELGRKGWELAEQMNRVIVFKRPTR